MKSKTKTKKLVSLLLSLLMIISVFTALPFKSLAVKTDIKGSASSSVKDSDFDYEILDDGTVEITNYYGSKTNLKIPKTLGGYTVTRIGNGAFEKEIDEPTNLKSVIIPNTVKSIGGSAFFNCENLKTIKIPNSVTSIDEEAFSGTAWYKKQPKGLVYAGKVACGYKGKCPKNVVIKKGTKGIACAAFKCTKLKEITIPSSVDNIEDWAFFECKNLKKIVIPKGVKNIGYSAFYECAKLKSIKIPNSVTNIGENALSKTPWYKNQHKGLVYAGKTVYKYKGSCPKTITLKKGTKGIASCAFNKCKKLRKITPIVL